MSGRPARARLGERGSITPFVVIVALAILALGGLVIDGGRQLNAHGRAIAYAEEASRAGAQEIDVTDPKLDLDQGLALRAANEYCTHARAEDPQLTKCEASIVSLDGDAAGFHGVQVDTSVQLNAILLGIIGRPVLTAGGEALARPVSGITGPDSARLDALPPPAVATPGGPSSPAETVLPTNPIETIPPCPTPTPTKTKTPKTPKPSKPSKSKKPNAQARAEASDPPSDGSTPPPPTPDSTPTPQCTINATNQP